MNSKLLYISLSLTLLLLSSFLFFNLSLNTSFKIDKVELDNREMYLRSDFNKYCCNDLEFINLRNIISWTNCDGVYEEVECRNDQDAFNNINENDGVIEPSDEQIEAIEQRCNDATNSLISYLLKKDKKPTNQSRRDIRKIKFKSGGRFLSKLRNRKKRGKRGRISSSARMPSNKASLAKRKREIFEQIKCPSYSKNQPSSEDDTTEDVSELMLCSDALNLKNFYDNDCVPQVFGKELQDNIDSSIEKYDLCQSPLCYAQSSYQVGKPPLPLDITQPAYQNPNASDSDFPGEPEDISEENELIPEEEQFSSRSPKVRLEVPESFFRHAFLNYALIPKLKHYEDYILNKFEERIGGIEDEVREQLDVESDESSFDPSHIRFLSSPAGLPKIELNPIKGFSKILIESLNKTWVNSQYGDDNNGKFILADISKDIPKSSNKFRKVKKIMQDNCFQCHGSRSSINLEGNQREFVKNLRKNGIGTKAIYDDCNEVWSISLAEATAPTIERDLLENFSEISDHDDISTEELSSRLIAWQTTIPKEAFEKCKQETSFSWSHNISVKYDTDTIIDDRDSGSNDSFYNGVNIKRFSYKVKRDNLPDTELVWRAGSDSNKIRIKPINKRAVTIDLSSIPNNIKLIPSSSPNAFNQTIPDGEEEKYLRYTPHHDTLGRAGAIFNLSYNKCSALENSYYHQYEVSPDGQSRRAVKKFSDGISHKYETTSPNIHCDCESEFRWCLFDPSDKVRFVEYYSSSVDLLRLKIKYSDYNSSNAQSEFVYKYIILGINSIEKYDFKILSSLDDFNRLHEIERLREENNFQAFAGALPQFTQVEGLMRKVHDSNHFIKKINLFTQVIDMRKVGSNSGVEKYLSGYNPYYDLPEMIAGNPLGDYPLDPPLNTRNTAENLFNFDQHYENILHIPQAYKQAFSDLEVYDEELDDKPFPTIPPSLPLHGTNGTTWDTRYNNLIFPVLRFDNFNKKLSERIEKLIENVPSLYSAREGDSTEWMPEEISKAVNPRGIPLNNDGGFGSGEGVITRTAPSGGINQSQIDAINTFTEYTEPSENRYGYQVPFGLKVLCNRHPEITEPLLFFKKYNSSPLRLSDIQTEILRLGGEVHDTAIELRSITPTFNPALKKLCGNLAIQLHSVQRDESYENLSSTFPEKSLENRTSYSSNFGIELNTNMDFGHYALIFGNKKGFEWFAPFGEVEFFFSYAKELEKKAKRSKWYVAWWYWVKWFFVKIFEVIVDILCKLTFHLSGIKNLNDFFVSYDYNKVKIKLLSGVNHIINYDEGISPEDLSSISLGLRRFSIDRSSLIINKRDDYQFKKEHNALNVLTEAIKLITKFFSGFSDIFRSYAKTLFFKLVESDTNPIAVAHTQINDTLDNDYFLNIMKTSLQQTYWPSGYWFDANDSVQQEGDQALIDFEQKQSEIINNPHWSALDFLCTVVNPSDKACFIKDMLASVTLDQENTINVCIDRIGAKAHQHSLSDLSFDSQYFSDDFPSLRYCNQYENYTPFEESLHAVDPDHEFELNINPVLKSFNDIKTQFIRDDYPKSTDLENLRIEQENGRKHPYEMQCAMFVDLRFNGTQFFNFKADERNDSGEIEQSNIDLDIFSHITSHTTWKINDVFLCKHNKLCDPNINNDYVNIGGNRGRSIKRRAKEAICSVMSDMWFRVEERKDTPDEQIFSNVDYCNLPEIFSSSSNSNPNCHHRDGYMRKVLKNCKVREKIITSATNGAYSEEECQGLEDDIENDDDYRNFRDYMIRTIENCKKIIPNYNSQYSTKKSLLENMDIIDRREKVDCI
jgi:hypothetical protein